MQSDRIRNVSYKATHNITWKHAEFHDVRIRLFGGGCGSCCCFEVRGAGGSRDEEDAPAATIGDALPSGVSGESSGEGEAG